MALPAPVAFPAPAAFPQPQPDPQTFGLGPYDAASTGSLYLPPPTQIQEPFSSQLAAAMGVQLNDALGSSGQPVDTMTLQEAQAQTDRALARISTANPELAQQLAQQRGQEEDDRGFWGTVLQTVAESPIGKALEVMGRGAKIVPEVFTDTDESVWKNIGDALSGKSDKSMIDVLDKYGVLTGDSLFEKTAQSVLGFGLDVAVDPLTYLTMGMGSVGRAAATRTGAKVALKAALYSDEAGLSILDRHASYVGRQALGLADDASIEAVRGSALENVWKMITGQRESLARTGRLGALADDLSVVDADFIGGVLGPALRDGDTLIMQNAVKAADEAHKFIGKFGYNRLGEKMAEGLGINKGVMDDILNGMKKAGHFPTRQAYMEAKYAGALMGGWRFAVPGIRIISPVVWGTRQLDFSIARRFMAGLSGQYRIARAVESGALAPGVAKEALEAATQGGWKAVAERVPQVAHLFGDTAKGRLGTSFANASWQIGGITRNLGSAALVRGGGLGTMLSADARKTARNLRGAYTSEALQFNDEVAKRHGEETLVKDIAESGSRLDAIGNIVKRDDGTITQPEFQRTLHQLDRAVTDKLGDSRLIIRTLEAFPTAEAQRMGADAYYDTLEQSLMLELAGSPELPDALADLGARRAKAKAVEQQLAEAPEAALAARMYRVSANNTRDIYNELGGHISNVTTRAESQAVIHPLNRADVNTGHALQHNATYVLADDTLESSADTPGFGLAHITDNAQGRGYHLVQKDEVIPPMPGTRRLYRGEGKGTDIGEKGGSWFTSNPDYAREFLGEGSTLKYVDVPEEVANKYTKTGSKVLEVDGVFYGRDDIELPDNFVQRAKDLEPPRSEAVIALKNPVIINKDEAATMAGGKRPVTSTKSGLGVDIVAEADEYVKNTMEFFNEKWDEQIAQILRSGKFSAKTKEVQDALQFLGLDPEGMSDEMARVVLEQQDAIAARLRTQFYQDRGYDGVITIQGGKQDVIVFEKGFLAGDRPPIWQLSDNAPFLPADRGYFHRRMTSSVHEMLQGKNIGTETRRPADWDAHFSRATKDMDFSEAEDHIRGTLQDMGLNVGPDTPVLDIDISANLNAYVDGMANDASNLFLGRIGRKLQGMGLTRSPYVSHYVGPRYDSVPSQAYENMGRWLKTQSEKLWKVSQQVSKFQQKVAKQAQKDVAEVQRTLADLDERIHSYIDEQVGITERAIDKVTGRGDGPKPDFDYMRRRVERVDKFLRKAIDSGNVEDMGNGVFRYERPGFGETPRRTYFTMDENKKVTSFREVSADPSGKMNVFTTRLPEDKYKGITDSLLRQDLKDQGITDIVGFRKNVREQQLTPGSARARKRVAREFLTPEALKPGLVKQRAIQEAKLDALRRKTFWRTNTMRDVEAEWNRIRHDAEARVAEPKVALQIGDPDKSGMSKLEVPGLEGIYMPATMAEEFNRAARGFKSLNDFQKPWRQFLSWWKDWATWAWPGFHVRNMMGSWFNNWLGGVQVQDYIEVGRAMKARREVERGLEPKWSRTKLSREFLAAHGLSEYYFGTDATYADLASLFSGNGINSANSRSFGEARQGAELLDKAMAKPADSPWTIADQLARKPTRVGKPGRVVAKSLRNTGELTENLVRGAAFLQGMKQTNGDVMAAHSFTMMRHGDYGDLTDWEYGFIRDLVPFYKWMRTNTPLQIHQLFERPAHLMAVLHAQRNLFEISGVDYEEAKSKMPSWALHGLAFPTPGSTNDAINMVTADLPMNDLYQGAGEFFSSMLPLLRPAFESYVNNKSLFTGKPIEGKPVPVGWVDDVPFLGKLLSGIGIGDVGPDGAYFIDDKLQNVLGTLPVFSRFRNWIYTEPERAKLRGQALISATVGVGLREFGETEFRDEELNFYYSQVLPAMEYLKGIGYPLPTTDDLEAMYGAANNVLLANGIQPKGLV